MSITPNYLDMQIGLHGKFIQGCCIIKLYYPWSDIFSGLTVDRRSTEMVSQ